MRALAVTASIVFWTLVLGALWLAFFPGPESGEPIAVVKVTPRPPAPTPPANQPAPAPAPGGPTQGAADLPPGFAVEGLSPPPQAPLFPPQNPGAGATTNPPPATPGDGASTDPPPPTPGNGASAAPPEGGPLASQPMPTQPMATQAALTGSPPQMPVSPSQVEDAALETGSIPLIPVPVADLVERSEYGPLPKVAADGRRPADVYARPSRHAAKATVGGPGRVAILIGGMGLPNSPGDAPVAELPAAVSVAYAAYGRDLQERVAKLRAAGHEILLQIPLEPDNYPTEDPGPHTLLTTLPPEENIKRLQWLMSRFTGYVGVTNYMGAKFESSQISFLPVLEEVKSRGLLYLDDGSVRGSTAGQIASMLGLDYSTANVQIDASDTPEDIDKALAELERAARERGSAIGIASGKPATVKKLLTWSESLRSKGIVLVPVSAAVLSQRQS